MYKNYKVFKSVYFHGALVISLNMDVCCYLSKEKNEYTCHMGADGKIIGVDDV